MPLFRVKGKLAETKNPRNRQYLAKTEVEARSKAEAEGILVSSVEEIPPQPPTEKQLAYAFDLGIAIPDNVTKDEISDLISMKTSNDRPSTDRHRRFAEDFGLETTQYIGKKLLFDEIWNTLKKEGRQLEMLQWFTYRVYRQLVGGADNAPIDSPFDTTIVEVAHSLAEDDKAIASIRRHEGRSLIWFGEWTAPDESSISGGSNRTIGYKEASRLLKARLGMGEATKPSNVIRQNRKASEIKAQSEAGGCAGIVAIAFILPVSLLAYLFNH